jgi:hypothetical protein
MAMSGFGMSSNFAKSEPILKIFGAKMVRIKPAI